MLWCFVCVCVCVFGYRRFCCRWQNRMVETRTVRDRLLGEVEMFKAALSQLGSAAQANAAAGAGVAGAEAAAGAAAKAPPAAKAPASAAAGTGGTQAAADGGGAIPPVLIPAAATPPRVGNGGGNGDHASTPPPASTMLQVDFTPRNSVDASYVRMSASDFAPGAGEPLTFTPVRTPQPPRQGMTE